MLIRKIVIDIFPDKSYLQTKFDDCEKLEFPSNGNKGAIKGARHVLFLFPPSVRAFPTRV